VIVTKHEQEVVMYDQPEETKLYYPPDIWEDPESLDDIWEGLPINC
jgi:hypothetical protein